MTRDEWNATLATAPATANQRGAIHREFARLGFHDEFDRDERLAVCAALLGLAALDSTRDLSMGHAGQLVRVLGACASRADLPAPGAGNVPRDIAPPRPSGWPARIAELAAALYRSRSVPLAAP